MTQVSQPVTALENHCKLASGTLGKLGLNSVQRIIRYAEPEFVREFSDSLGGERSARSVYRCALTAQTYIHRIRRARSAGASKVSEADVQGEPALVDNTTKPGPPTWNNQFPQPAVYAPTGSIGEASSPAAYAVTLYDLAMQLEDDKTANDKEWGDRIRLQTRRPDIQEIGLNDVTLNQAVSKLSIVNELLQGLVDAKSPDIADDLDLSPNLPSDVLLARLRYPGITMPYHEAHDQASRAIQFRNLTLAQAARATDTTLPTFVVASLPSAIEQTAQRLGSGLSPAQVQLITSGVYAGGTPEENGEFCVTNFGSDDSISITTLPEFTDHTGLNPEQVRAMLCVAGTGTTASAVIQTPNATPVESIDGSVYGARYISGAQNKAVWLSSDSPAQLCTAPGTSDDYILPTTLDLTSRMFRLQCWTGLPFDYLDSLIVASNNAAGEVDDPEATPKCKYKMSMNTIRVLGVYQEWSKAYGVSADDFSAFVMQVEPYAVGVARTQFDRIFNAPGQVALTLGTEKDTYDYTDSSSSIVHSVCFALNIDNNVFQQLAAIVATEQKITPAGKLNRSIQCYSALYRLTKIPAYLKLTPPALLALLARMPNGAALQTNLAGKQPAIAESKFDYLGQLRALGDLVDFLKRQNFTLTDFTTLVPPYPNGDFDAMTASQAEVVLINAVKNQLPAALFTEANLNSLNLPATDSSGEAVNWWSILTTRQTIGADPAVTIVVDGLIAVENSATRESAIKAGLNAGHHTFTVDPTPPLLDALTAAQRQQYSITDATLGQALSLKTEVVHEMMQAFTPDTVTGGGSYSFLSACQSAHGNTELEQASDIPTTLTNQLSLLARQAALVQRYALTAAGLQGLRNRAQWFGLSDTIVAHWKYWMLSLPTLYALDAYAAWLKVTGNEDTLLQYLRDTNSGAGPKALDACNRLAQQLGVDIVVMQQAIDCIAGTAAGTGILTTVIQLGQALSLLSMSKQAGLAINQLTGIGLLPTVATALKNSDVTDASYEKWRIAATSLMATLTVPPAG